jgi:hypothetical protein
MSDGVHARVKAVQAAGGQSARDRAPVHSDRNELRPGDDSVLAVGAGGDRPVEPRSVDECTHTV